MSRIHMLDEGSYRYCPRCGTRVPVERKFPRGALVLVLLMASSLLLTALLFPRLIFLFVFLPFGFGLWKRREHCALCGERLSGTEALRKRNLWERGSDR